MPNEDNKTKEVREKPVKEKTLVTWKAPARPFKRRDREFYVTSLAIAGIIALILFLVEGFMPVILVISFVFLFYVLSTVPPEDIEYQVTTFGVKIVDGRIDWENIKRFWFTKRFDSKLLVLETFSVPGRLELVIDKEKKEEIKNALEKYIVEEKTPASRLDKMTNWVANKLPQ